MVNHEEGDHTWIADGESWTETDHHDSCKYPDAENKD